MRGRLLTVVAGVAAAVPVMVLGWSPTGDAQSASSLVRQGRQLYLTGCISCHGQDGKGVDTAEGELRGPSLLDAGEAAAYYQLSTGRMPLADSEHQARRKDPAYNAGEIEALVAYVASLGGGPKLPRVDVAKASTPQGGELFRANCAPCHSASGAGGALSYGRSAPALSETTALEAAAAMRAGPGQMPQFGPSVLSGEDVADIARYIQYLRDPDDRGGFAIGRLGPVPEGFVAWFFGMGAFIGALLWIGTRSPLRERRHG